MHLPKDRPASPGRALAASLLTLLVACQPSGGERAMSDASAAGAPNATSVPAPNASAPTTRPAPATIPAPAPTPPPATLPAPSGPVPAPPTDAVAKTVSLAIGEELPIAADTRLRLLRIVNDSRCPKDTQCIWAGEVKLEFELSAGRSKARFELSQATQPRATAKGKEFELLAFGPCPSGQGRMADAECASVAISAPAER